MKSKVILAAPGNTIEIEKKPKRSRKVKGLEIGQSGTRIYEGIVYDEYNSKLRDSQGIEIYDEMRRSDGTVKAVVLSTMLPVIKANWYVQPGEDTPESEAQAAFISRALFELTNLTWSDILRHALLCMPLGVMVMEKVFDIIEVDGEQRIIWGKLAPRMPKSIQAWQMSDKQPGIQQRTQDGPIADIPMEKLLVFVHDKEGDNWWGSPILRPAYKHWHMKNTFYKIDAIAAERQGLGIPYAKMPENFTEANQAQAETILKNMRANEQAFAIIPTGYEIGFMDMNARTTRDLSPSIQHHNREITKSVLAQFLELGATDSGSRALSTDQSDLFLQSLEAVAKNISDVFNKSAIKELIDLNFNNVTTYPILTYSGITRTDVKALAETYASLTTSKGISPDPADEPHFRNLLGLPERTTDADEMMEEEPVDQDPDIEETIDEVGLSDHSGAIKKKSFPERKEISQAITASIKDLSLAHKMAFLKRNLGTFSQFSSKHALSPFFSMVKGELAIQLAQLRKLAFEENNGFKGYRPLTLAESKVDFESIEKNLDRLEEAFDTDTQKLLHAEREKFMNALTRAVTSGDKNAVKDATFKIQATYQKIIKEAMKEAYTYGRNNAAKEISKKAPAFAKAILDQIDIQAQAIAEMHIADMITSAKNALVTALNKGESAAKALASADEILAAKIDKLTVDTSRVVVAGYVNTGRAETFDAYFDDIYALQRSELLDNATCNYCISVDGRVIEKDDPFGQNTIFHSNCRGIWVSIMLDEKELPKIGGIPNSVRDRFGDAVNDLIQPKDPITKKDSAGRREVERRLRRKAGE